MKNLILFTSTIATLSIGCRSVHVNNATNKPVPVTLQNPVNVITQSPVTVDATAPLPINVSGNSDSNPLSVKVTNQPTTPIIAGTRIETFRSLATSNNLTLPHDLVIESVFTTNGGATIGIMIGGNPPLTQLTLDRGWNNIPISLKKGDKFRIDLNGGFGYVSGYYILQ